MQSLDSTIGKKKKKKRVLKVTNKGNEISFTDRLYDTHGVGSGKSLLLIITITWSTYTHIPCSSVQANLISVRELEEITDSSHRGAAREVGLGEL